MTSITLAQKLQQRESNDIKLTKSGIIAKNDLNQLIFDTE
jgi:hypothetical protein